MNQLAARGFRLRSGDVVSEVIDGEAIIMDLRSGHYFSARDVGCFIWERISAGQYDLAVCDEVLARFEVGQAECALELNRFLDELLTNKLIVIDDSAAATAPPAAAAGPGRRAFVAPRLSAYTDMADLLLLDPIHDVEEVGWPTRKPTEPAADDSAEAPREPPK